MQMENIHVLTGSVRGYFGSVDPQGQERLEDGLCFSPHFKVTD